jgi:hypothetical protein
MPWYNASWLYRKKLTVAAASVHGSSVLAGVPVFFEPSDDSDIVANARADGKDLVFTSSDGTTQLPHELLPSSQFGTRDGIWTWFSRNRAVYSAAGSRECSHIGVASRFNTNTAQVIQYNHATGALTRTEVGTTLEQDDHNTPSLLVRSSDSRLLVAYPKEHGNGNIGLRISTSVNDSTAWGSETALDPDGTSTYSYPSLFEFGGTIYLTYRHGLTSIWRMITSTDNGATWSASTAIISGGSGWGTNPYMIAACNGSSRLDFLFSEGDGNDATNCKIKHCYYDGTNFKTSAGVTISSPPFDSDELTTVYDGGTNPVWLSDLTYDSNGRPHALFYVYPSAVDTNQDLYEAEVDGSGVWTTRKVCDEGTGVEQVSSTIYPGVSCLDPADDTIAWVSTEVSSVYEIQKWQKTGGTWAKASGADGDVTAGSLAHHFRPTIVTNCPTGKKGRLLFCSPYDYTGFVDFRSGIAGFPAFGSNFAAAYVRANLDGANATDLYVYYGYAAVSSDQQNVSGTWADYLRVYHTREPYGGTPGRYRDASGNGPVIAKYDNGAEQSGPTNVGTSLSVNGNLEAGVLTLGTPNLAADTALLYECWVHCTIAAGDEHAVAGHLATGTEAAFLLRIEPTGPVMEAFVTKDTNSFAGGTVSTIVPTANTWQYHAIGWTPGGGLVARINKTEGSVGSTTGTALDATASTTLTAGCQGSFGNDPFAGYQAELRLLDDTFRSKDFTDTQYDNWANGNGFFTIGSEEDVPTGNRRRRFFMGAGV